MRLILDNRFPPTIKQEQIDSLVSILESEGVIAKSSLTDLPDEIMDIRTRKQEPTVLLFVSSICSACGTQIDILKNLQRDGLRFNTVVVFLGPWKDGQKRRYLDDTALTCCTSDPVDYVDKLMISSVPTCIVADALGNQMMRFDGLASYEQLFSVLVKAASKS